MLLLRAVGDRNASCVCMVVERMFPRLVTFTATGRSTAHTKCRNEVEDLERSVKLCGRAVADNANEAGNGSARYYDTRDRISQLVRSEVDILSSILCSLHRCALGRCPN